MAGRGVVRVGERQHGSWGLVHLSPIQVCGPQPLSDNLVQGKSAKLSKSRERPNWEPPYPETTPMLRQTGFATPAANSVAATRLAARFCGASMFVPLGVPTRRLLASALCGVMLIIEERLPLRRGVLIVAWAATDSLKGAPSVIKFVSWCRGSRLQLTWCSQAPSLANVADGPSRLCIMRAWEGWSLVRHASLWCPGCCAAHWSQGLTQHRQRKEKYQMVCHYVVTLSASAAGAHISHAPQMQGRRGTRSAALVTFPCNASRRSTPPERSSWIHNSPSRPRAAHILRISVAQDTWRTKQRTCSGHQKTERFSVPLARFPHG